MAKEKTAAVLLAVFLSFWSWLYTYKVNAWKFWTGLGICVFFFWLLFLPPIGVWIWAIVDNATKDEKWYKNFK
jgi:hypothetical protein